jgi:hypothetical protein
MNRLYVSVAVGLLCALLLPSCARAQEEEPVDPMLDIVFDMNSAAVQLTKLKTGKPTQEPQQAAIGKLDRLIEELEKQCAACRGGSVNPNPTRPAADSVIRSGPGGSGKLHAERREGKQWGELPAKERERILQSMNDGFPSHYQAILERYFARLADEKPVGDNPVGDASVDGAPASGSSAPRAPGSGAGTVAPDSKQPGNGK